jgi:hypothetical protein
MESVMGLCRLDQAGRCQNCGGTELSCWGDEECNDWHRFPTLQSAAEPPEDDDAPSLAPEIEQPAEEDA